MSHERVWQRIGRGEGGFQVARTFATIEHSIFVILEKILNRHLTFSDVVGTRIVKRFAEAKELYGGSMQLDCFFRGPPTPFEKVHFRLCYCIDTDKPVVVSCTKVIIYYDDRESLYYGERKSLYTPSERRIHIHRFVSVGMELDFRELPIPAGSDPFSAELWLGKQSPNFGERKIEFVLH